jgi:hypothetical protein
LKKEIERLENLRKESNKEKNELISHYRDHISDLKKTIETLTLENEKRKHPTVGKEPIQINSFNTQNIINVGIKNINKISTEDNADVELRLLELESKLLCSLFRFKPTLKLR